MSVPPDYPNGGTLLYRVAELEKDVGGLSHKVDRLMWAILSLMITVAASSLAILITFAASGGTP